MVARLRPPTTTDLLLLAAEELDRARRLPDDRVRGRWVAARALLRRTLAPWVGADPADLAFAHGTAGKPALPDGPEFSLAHSHDHALVAVCRDAAVGADLERVRDRPVAPPSVERWFAAEERAELERLAGADRVNRFFELWTLKEAYWKARGTGVTRGRLGGLPAAGWVAERPPVPSGYAAAIVVLAPSAAFEFTTA